jgi:SOS-response transcriptional repressor LexA
MTTLGIRLRQARKNKKISQKALAELIGIKQQAVQRIERGDVKNTSYMVELALALDVSPDWLAMGKEWQPPISYTTDLQGRYTPTLVNHAPLLSWEAIEEMRNLPLEANSYTSIPVFKNSSDKCFVLQVDDNSMQSTQADTPTFLTNDLIIIDTSRQPKHNDFVIAKLPKLPSVVFRHYVIEKNVAMLKGLNPEYPDITVTPDVEMIGVVFIRYTKFN